MNVKGKYKLVNGVYVINRKSIKLKKKRGKRGRPVGYKMSTKSKAKTSASKMGYSHNEETKKKISDGVKRFHEVGAPIKVLMEIDLDECGKFKKGEYICVGIPNPIVGDSAYHQLYHVALVERFLGRKLKGQEEIHHWGDKCDNRFELLSLCKTRSEHKMLDKIKNRTNKGE